jgi:hypothetical protein
MLNPKNWMTATVLPRAVGVSRPAIHGSSQPAPTNT